MSATVAGVDIARFAAGNCGIPYVFRIDSGRPGPVVTVLSLTHGNEVAGAIVMAELLDRGFRPVRGSLNLVFANYRALGRPGESPRRFVDHDLNRVWDCETLDGGAGSWEIERAKALKPLLESTDYLLDLHTTATDDPPFLISAAHPAAYRLVDRMTVPSRHVVFERPMHQGLLLIEACGFSEATTDRVALVVECGRHDSVASVDLARRATEAFLIATAAVDELSAPVLGGLPSSRHVYVARTMIMAQTDTFRFSRGYRSFDRIEPGEVYAHDGDQPLRAGFAEAVLLMPRLAPRAGGEAVLLAQALDTIAI